MELTSLKPSYGLAPSQWLDTYLPDHNVFERPLQRSATIRKVLEKNFLTNLCSLRLMHISSLRRAYESCQEMQTCDVSATKAYV